MAPVVYERRAPEHTVLWACVNEHLPAFRARAAEEERTLPSFVDRELEGFLRCGLLEHGFARVGCKECDFTRLVPWSCKGRGVCPSCVSRRMSDTAAFLTDHLFPVVPVRQWVLSLPPPLRYLLAWDTELCAAVVGLFMRAVRRHLQAVAKREGVVRRMADAEHGAVAMVQRWGGSANLNVHIHALVADGLFVTPSSEASEVVFRALPAPEKGEVAAVAWEVCERTVALLRKRGQWLDASPDGDDALAEREPLLARLYGASLAGTLVFGERSGQRQVRLYGTAARPLEDASAGRVSNAYGFDVHAGVRVSANDRVGLERLARYMTRPPLSKQRLSRQEDGRYRIALKTPWRDGTTHIVLDGPELVGRLAALVPSPRFHLTRYYGVFAPRSKLRPAVVPRRGPGREASCDNHDAPPTGGASGAPVAPGAGLTPPEPESDMTRRRRLAWSKLLARVFAVDVLSCPKCGSSMQRVEVCTSAARISAVMREVETATGPPEELSAA